jgi:polyhydroxybutyrate depolymerase
MKIIAALSSLVAGLFALTVTAVAQPFACGSGGVVYDGNGAVHRPYQELTMTMSSGEERMYLLRLPAAYDGTTPSDVVFSFHGATSNAQEQIAYADFSDLADRDNVIIVAPDANNVFPDRDHELATYWDSAWEGTKRVRDHDLKFVIELVEKLQSDYCTGRFYATGMSAGGDMTTALQCVTDGPFLAYAPVTYRYYHVDECAGARPRPMISFHGTEDRVVPLEGLPAPWFDPHVGEIMQSWAEVNGCDAEVIEEQFTRNVIRYHWANCEAKTEWYLVEGGGHTWPGGGDPAMRGNTTEEIDASEMIWSFFFD